MSFVKGYEHDVFISYAHSDNPVLGTSPGWVAQLVDFLAPVLKQRLAGHEPKIFFDRQKLSANYLLSTLSEDVQKSALFLAISSPSYISRDWPLKELDSFIQSSDKWEERVFAIECLPLKQTELYPFPLDKIARRRFWHALGDQRVSVSLSPNEHEAGFLILINELAVAISQKLEDLRILPARSPQPTSLPVLSRRISGDVETRKPLDADVKFILLAQSTDDVEDEAIQLRQYLKQYREEAVVLPDSGLPQGGDAFQAAFASQLKNADLFVQLLGRSAGRVPPDLLEGYTRYQFQAAKSAGVSVLQWRHPELDARSVHDPAYRTILEGETVVAIGFEGFKRQILEWVRRPTPKAPPRVSSVFINADERDISIAKEIERECLRQALTTILPVQGLSCEATRKDLAENLTDCDVLVFIYGDTSLEWIRSQLRFFSKIKGRRDQDPRLLAICSGPPPKPDPGIHFPNAQVISCPNCWDLEQIRNLIFEVAR